MSHKEGKKIIYDVGEIVGDYGCIFLKEIKESKPRRALFQCGDPDCNETFEADITRVKNNKKKNCGNYKHSKKYKEIINNKFGLLTPIKPTDKRSNTCVVWECKCDCGEICYVSSAHLTKNPKKITISCGCQSGGPYDLTGQKFNKLTAIKKIKKRGGYWAFDCECGGSTIARAYDVKNNKTKSCGCLKSHGELIISELLTKLNINFIRQYTFNNCRSDNNCLLYFDFYLPDYNCCIEYDGEQHFFYRNSGWNTKENYELTQRRDEIKNQYCKDNNIQLIRIPYYHKIFLNIQYIQEILKNGYYEEK